ncbi:unnamed protein product [Candidula unifasciata]|uniref:AIG1-type G domain-containing protein n=1 Tax=Candidula unifasciata TaxID=100452 RepID=A0A8S3Z5P0_9EUPU|nr:unnamed protein product [Candidula unifasciata]
MAASNQIDLLLIGKTGNGKSATGNSILRRKAFKSRASTNSVTSTVDYEVSEFNGRIIKVVDGPGVGDTRINTEAAVNLVMTTMEYAIAANPRGYHAFLLIVRFGGRFSEEDQDTIDFLKKIFGQDFVKEFCILVLTCGDNFRFESEDSGKSFEEWCNEEQGKFKDLLKECDNRVVLFDNTTKDPEKKNKQIENLLKIVDSLSSKGQRYNDDNFERARVQRNTIMVELKKSAITEETMTETSLIIMKLQELQATEDLRSKIYPLEKLQSRVECLLESVSCKDRATGALHDLISTVKSLKSNINDDIKLCYRMMEEREKMKRQEEEIRRKYEEEMQILKEQYDRKAKEDAKVLEEHRRYEKEQARLKAEMEEKNKREKEALEKKHKEERDIMQTKSEELEKEYRKMKEENDKGIVRRVYEGVTWPFRAAGNWLFSN